MLRLAAVVILVVCAVTGVAVAVYSSQGKVAIAQAESETAIAQAETDGIIAQAESQAEIAGYEASVDLAGIRAELEIARLQLETNRLANLIESEKVQAALAQTNAMLTQSAVDLEKAKLERQRMWMMLALPSLAVILVVCVVLVVMVVVLRRPVVRVRYPEVTERVTSREIVKQAPVGVILATKVERREGVDVYAVR